MTVEEAYLDLASPAPLVDADRSRDRWGNGASPEPASAAIVQPGDAVLPLAEACSLLGNNVTAEIGRIVGHGSKFLLAERGRSNGREKPIASLTIVKARHPILALLVGLQGVNILHDEQDESWRLRFRVSKEGGGRTERLANRSREEKVVVYLKEV